MVESGYIFIMGAILLVSLIMTVAFLTLNSKLEDENRSLKEKISEYEKRSNLK